MRPAFGKMVIPHTNGIILISIQEIEYCQADGNYTRIHLGNGEIKLTSKCLKHVMKQLPKTHFQRIHQSYGVNIEYFSNISTCEVTLYNNTTLPLSRRNRKSLMDRFHRR